MQIRSNLLFIVLCMLYGSVLILLEPYSDWFLDYCSLIGLAYLPT